MSAENTIVIGSTPIFRGVYSDSAIYYKENVVTMYNCVFKCNGNLITGIPPVEMASDGTISLTDTGSWNCLIDNTLLYNAALSTNNLVTRISSLENVVENQITTELVSLQNALNKMGVVIPYTESPQQPVVGDWLWSGNMMQRFNGTSFNPVLGELGQLFYIDNQLCYIKQTINAGVYVATKIEYDKQETLTQEEYDILVDTGNVRDDVTYYIKEQ